MHMSLPWKFGSIYSQLRNKHLITDANKTVLTIVLTIFKMIPKVGIMRRGNIRYLTALLDYK